VLETTGGQLKFVGIVSAGMKVLHKTTPGKRFYMVSGENAELLEAELAGGKTYYVYVSPRLGFWRSRFVFVPVTDKELATDSFRNDLAWCKWHENKPEGNEWFVANLPSLQAKYTDALEQYQKAGPEERKVIKPVYGTAVPVDSMGAP
jgi:hypothetical protein